MAVKRKKQLAFINTFVPILVILVALWYLFGGETKKTVESIVAKPAPTANASSRSVAATSESKQSAGSPSQPAKPQDDLPAGFPADRVVRTQPPSDVSLPPDLQRQLDASPPELPEDLKAQLNAPPPEMPEDLKAQLNAPPPEIPEDIKRAMQTPPRIVTIDEVNDPDFLKKQGK